MSQIISGKNAVKEALSSGMALNRVWIGEGIDENYAGLIFRLCKQRQIPISKVPKHKLQQIAGDDHRGVAAELAAASYVEVADIIAAAAAKGEPPLIVLLDGVEDPHNLGAIIRSAYCLGAHGVIIAKKRAAQVNETVLKTSAGAAAQLPIARVANLNQAIASLKQQNCWVLAMDMDGSDISNSDLTLPTVLILGSEGKGIAPLLKSNCDAVVKIAMADNQIGSLNVSNAAAIMLYEAARQRGQK